MEIPAMTQVLVCGCTALTGAAFGGQQAADATPADITNINIETKNAFFIYFTSFTIDFI
jgi:hypothetical protein